MNAKQSEELQYVSLNEIHHEIACENNQKLLTKLQKVEQERGKDVQSLVSIIEDCESESPIYKCSKKCSDCISIDKSGDCAIKKEIKKLEPRFPDFCKGIGVDMLTLLRAKKFWKMPAAISQIRIN